MSFPIIDKLGGWIEADTIMRANGIRASDAAREKWRERRIPRNAAIALGAAAASRGIRFSVADFEFHRPVKNGG